MSFIREPNAEPIPGYRLIEPLGSGGFGEVWKCEAPGGLFKAIKFVYGNVNSLDVEGARAEQELRALQRIKEVRHPFVLSLDRIELVAGELVIVMELADKSLHDAYVECQSAGLVGIPRDALLRYLRDAAEALDHMNEKHGLQHLDIKPRNLFLISDRVKVADFGLVKHLERTTGSGLLGGVTPLYASPETFGGKITDRSDQYSLAVVYQELLTGQRPFSGKNVRQLAQQHVQEEPELRSLPEAERPIVTRALAKDPAKRFPSCLAFVRALYTTHGQGRTEGAIVDLTAGAERPKTMAETMEDIQLQQDALASDSPPPEGENQGSGSQLGITVAQPQTGALRPTIIIGVGSFGRRALLELRCRFVDRFGDLDELPLFRFVYVDSDPEAVQAAVRGTPEVAFTRGEVHHLPLQPVGQYRRRMLDQLTEWLPREKLYAVPRSLQTQGSRALGRLAFVDNHNRFLARIRREVQKATQADTLYRSVSQTGLALRDGVPRVYLIAAAGGGSSGCLVDLGYVLRRELQQLRHADAEVTALLFCGAPGDPATPRGEQANVYATLTELNHFSDPAVPFAAQYGPEGPRLIDQGQPFSTVYVLQLANRSPEVLRDLVAHLGSYLFHELTTPLGLRLDHSRHLSMPAGGTPFRSFGTYSVWFPRGLLLRLAARQTCKKLCEEWQAEGAPTALAEVEAACARTLTDSELRPEAVCARLEELASGPLEATPAAALTAVLAGLEEQTQQSIAQEDPGNWARQALVRVREWVGSGQEVVIGNLNTSSTKSSDWRKSRLCRGLNTAAEGLAAQWNQRFAKAAFALMDHPGKRVAAAQVALTRFAQFCQEAAAGELERAQEMAQRTEQAWQYLETALAECLTGPGGFSLFGNRVARCLRVFMDRLAAFARQRLAEEVVGASQQFFVYLHGQLGERLRELSFCRQRLRHLQESLESPIEENEDTCPPRLATGLTPGHSPLPSTESFWESIRQTATARVVLPEEEEDLERAASRFLKTLGPEQWTQLDQRLQDSILSQLGGLQAACASTSELGRNLAQPLLHQAATYLGELLPVTDVAQVEIAAAQRQGVAVPAQAKTYLDRATPLVEGKDEANRESFLLVPASEAGKVYGEETLKALPDLQLVRVPGQAHLMFCQEQGFLSADDLHQFLRPCRRVYEELNTVPQASPHARFDILDWLPIDP